MPNNLIRASVLLLLNLFGTQIASAGQQQKTKPPLTECLAGADTLLLTGGLPREPRHDGKNGEALFVLKDKTTQAVRRQSSYPGEGVCLGYDAASMTYLVGLKKERGIGVRMTSLLYIDEKSNRDRVSAFDKKKLEAFAAVPSPNGRFIALIALEGNDISLFVLDTERNAISRLGKAPLPPPFSAREREYAHQHAALFKDDTAWDWMSDFRDGYMPLDSGILQFEGNDVLDVSYGNDSSAGRSGTRKLVKFKLAELEGHRQ